MSGALDRVHGIGDPARPRRGEQCRTRPSGQLQGEHFVGCGHTAAAVGRDRSVLGHAERQEPTAERTRVEEAPVDAEVASGRRVHRTRDVSGHRIDGLDIAAVALGRPGIEQDAAPPAAMSSADTVGIAPAPTATGPVPATGGSGSPVAIAPPSAVHAANPPSSTCTRVWPIHRRSHHSRAALDPAVVVVGHDVGLVADTPASGGDGEHSGVRERMATVLRSSGAGELGRQIDVHRTRDAAGDVLATGVTGTERPAHVEHDRRHRRAEKRAQLARRDQRRHGRFECAAAHAV